MIIPPKHQNLEKTIINIGALIIKNVKKKDKFIDDIYYEITNKNKCLENLLIDDFILSIIFLLTLDLIKLKEGLISIR